jgi:hypothetical protein
MTIAGVLRYRQSIGGVLLASEYQIQKKESFNVVLFSYFNPDKIGWYDRRRDERRGLSVKP